MINPDQPDFTARAFTAEQLRERWGYHNVRALVGLLVDILLLGGAGFFFITGNVPAFVVFFVLETTTAAWAYCHFGAARAVARLAFGRQR